MAQSRDLEFSHSAENRNDQAAREVIDLLDDVASSRDGGKDFPVIDDFAILGEIGRGGMGIVYLAEQVSLNRKVALKILPSHLSFSDEAVLKFRREAEAGGRQSHAGIVAVHAVGEQRGVHYIAQEYVEGGRTLNDKLREFAKEGERPSGYFRDVAELVAAVADALQHAHDSRVIHRDIKPSNVLLTRDGKPKVTDFGLAKVEDALALSRTGDFAGTPYYMSPEQAMSRRMGIDRRTDIYSLGVTLYELLTLKRPFEGDTSHEVLKKIIYLDPVNPHRDNPRVPRDLGTICLKAIEKLPERRYQTMREFGEDLRRYLSGDVILAKPAGIRTRIWKQIKRNPVVSAALGIAAVTLLVFAIVVPWIIAVEERRAQIEISQHAAVAEFRLQEIMRLSDLKTMADLRLEAEELWPADPANISRYQTWLERARRLSIRLPAHRRTLQDLDSGSFPYSETEISWWRDTLVQLVNELESFADDNDGAIEDIDGRLTFATTIEKRSIDDHRQAWDEAIRSISDTRQCPHYGGLEIAPQIGFVPIGRDPESGLWEFAHLQTGSVPVRGQDGKLILTDEMGLVFVLLPGGVFEMGAIPPSEDHVLGSPNVDPDAWIKEGPVHEVTIEPFLLSKYEMSQGQWMRFTKDNPSCYKPGKTFGGKTVTLLNPVESVTWETCASVVSRLNLRLPSEAEWEFATRAGTSTIWWTGNEKESVTGAANIADLCCKTNGADPSWTYEEWLDDGHVIHARVGSYRPNGFGLHDVCGNVAEYCEDDFHETYASAPCDGSAWVDNHYPHRICRGGHWGHLVYLCRSSQRRENVPGYFGNGVGLRPACSLTQASESD